MRTLAWLCLRLLVASLAVVAPGCERREAAPAPSSLRIVALSPALAITLRDLGLEGAVVGRHGYDMALARSVPVCGDQGGIDYEALLGVRPTHIFLEWGSRPLPARLAGLAARHGWVVRSYPLLTLDEIEAATRSMHAAVLAWCEGNESGRPVPDAARLLERMERAWSPREEGLYKGRILLLAGVDPPSALGPGSFHHQVLERIGGRAAITDGMAYITLDAETLAGVAPDGIILILPRGAGAAPARADPLERLGRLGRLDLPAVRAGRVALIDHPLGLTPSTALVEVADEMAAILRAWADD